MTESLYTTKIDSSAPTTSTTGVVGQFYIDTSATPSALYLCTSVDTTVTPNTYEWTLQGGSSGGGVQQDTSATSVETLESALETLRTAGKTILSIEFTPSSDISKGYNKISCDNFSTPVFTFDSLSTIRPFQSGRKYILPFTKIDNDKNFTFNFGDYSLNIYKAADNSIVGYLNFRRITITTSLLELVAITNANIVTDFNNAITSYTINYI